MKWLTWFKHPDRRTMASPMQCRDPTHCPDCGQRMALVEKNTMSGRDLRTYRCGHCQKEHDVDLGVAMWKLMSDASNQTIAEHRAALKANPNDQLAKDALKHFGLER